MIVLLGESGSGKSSFEKMLCKKLNLSKIVSYTTRPIRANEINGIDYHFISDIEFLKKLYNNELAEHYVAKNAWHYGIDKKDCHDDKICVVTPNGLSQLKKIEELSISSIYIKSSKETRKERLWDRGDNHHEMIRRFKTDEEDFANIDEMVDRVVINEGSIIETFDTLVQVLSKWRII